MPQKSSLTAHNIYAIKTHITPIVAWVRRFFAKHPGRRRRDLGRTEIVAFLAETAQGSGMSNWQVQQVRDAFIGLALSKSQGISAPEAAKAEPTTKISTGLNWPALDERLRECLRLEHYSYRTEQTYVAWIRRFVLFHQWRKPSSLGADHVHGFLRYLAMEKQVASSTQNQALNAVVFLYHHDLHACLEQRPHGRGKPRRYAVTYYSWFAPLVASVFPLEAKQENY